MVPQGRLIIIGNAKLKTTGKSETVSANNFPSREIVDFLTEYKTDRIEVITAGSATEDMQGKCSGVFSEIGFNNFGFIHISEDNVNENYLLNRLSEAKTVFFIGDQSRTYEVLKNSGILRHLYKKYLFENGFTIAGLNLGAMCIPGVMMCDTMNNENMELAPGLGFLNNCIVDAQFEQTTFKKLVYTVIQNREFLGVGLGENTALIVNNGFLATCKGSGAVVIVDAKDVRQEHVDLVMKGSSVFAERMKGHVLTHGRVINLRSGEIHHHMNNFQTTYL